MKSQVLARGSALALLTALLVPAAAEVRINEFMASNRSTLADEDGDFSDWIELHNPSAQTADVSGWGLSDNPASPFKWTFGPGTEIPAGGYFLVWASGKSRLGADTPVTAPNELGGLVVWLRADTSPHSAGEPVTTWSDSSGSRNHATQPLASQRPTLVENAINGLPAINFNRSNSQQLFLPTAGFSGMKDFSNFTFLTVARWTGGSVSGLFGGYRGANNANAGSMVFEIPNAGGNFRLRIPNTIDVTATAAVTQNQWHLLGTTMNGPAATAQVFRDGQTVASATGTPGTTLLANFERIPIGSSHDNVRTFGGQIAEVVVFNRSLPPDELASLERHFIAKYNLPVAGAGAPSHPHSNFNISAAGEPLILTRPDGVIADQIAPVALPTDVSYGRTLSNPSVWSMLETPTPGAPNQSPAYIEPPAPVTFSHPSGIHTSSFQLSLNHPDPDITIIYTLDGSEPDINNLAGTSYQFRSSYNTGALIPLSFTSLSYSAPIPVNDRSPSPNKISLIASTSDSNPSYLPASPVKKATVVRARAYRQGKAGPSAAATYFVSTTEAFNYDIPLVSLTFNEDGFFDYHKGIYVAGVDHVTSTGGRICSWGNFNRRGMETERQGHFQFFENGTLAVDQGVGFRIHGNCSRRNAFKSLRVHANDAYDPRSEFDHPFFDTPVPDAVLPENTLHKRLILRTPSINEVAFCRLYQPIYGGVGGRLRPVVTFFNGEYWGVSYLRDRLDQNYLARQYDLDSEQLALINIKYGHEVGSSDLRVFNLDAGIPSDMDDFWALRNFITGNNMASAERFAEAEAMLDMRSFIDHLILKIFAGDDHYAPEYIFWRSRTPQDASFGDGRWRVMVKDFDSTLFTPNYVTGLATGSHPRSFGFELFQSLLANPSFRNTFINRFADLLNAHFQPARFQEIIHHAYNEAAPTWNEMTARWNNVAFSNPNRPFTTTARDLLINWSNQHPARQRLHLRQHFGISSNVNLTVNVADPSQGRIRVNTIDISAGTPGLPSQPYPWSGSYFHNIPVTLTALPVANHRFTGWKVNGSSNVSSTNPALTLTPTSNTHVEAVFEELTPLHRWTFENPGTHLNPTFSVGGGNFSITSGATTEVLQASASQGFETGHLRLNNPLGAVLDLAIPTTQFETITLSFLTRRSGQGAGIQTLSYTLNGTTWTELESYPVADANPSEKSFDFSSIAGVSNNPQFAIRITFAQGIGGSAGNHRFDDFVVAGNLLPGAILPPVPTNQLPERIDLVEGSPTTSFDISPWFADSNGGPLSFAAHSSRPTQATATLSGSSLMLTGLQRGESLLTLTADDGQNPPVAATVRILIHPAPHPLGSGTFSFTAWNANAPEHTYPNHMLFLQGTENDSSLTTSLDRAYHIPHDDYAEADLTTVGFPYNNTARTRINGLEANGIAFINTGRARDLGAALLALDTTGLADARVAFTAGTILPNVRVYAIRMQYRIGTTGPFTDLTNSSGQPVEYVRNPLAGHSAVLGPFDLPPAALNQPYVQLLWRYHRLEGTSGARAQLRLDDVVVTSESATPPATLVFESHPSGVQSGMPFGTVVVRLLDAAGLPATGFNGPVTLSLTGSGALGGTLVVNAVQGLATFDNLVITGSGGFQLLATAAGLTPAASPAIRSLALTNTLVPQFIQGGTDALGANNERVPFAWRARIDGLLPHADYRFANRMVLASDSPTSDGAGNMIFITSATENWLRTTATPSFDAGTLGTAHFTFTAGADGSFTGWFITEPTANARFTPGNAVFPRLLLNDGEGGTQTNHVLTTTGNAAVIRFGTASWQGSAIIGQASTAARRIALLFADAAGLDRPLAATPIEITGAGADERYAPFYRDSVATRQSHWGTILPNQLPGGLQRVEFRSVIGDEPPLDTRIETDGFSGTVDPSSGLTPIVLNTDSGLPIFLPGDSATWHAATNWSTGVIPNNPAAVAIVNAPTLADRNVNVNATTTVGSLRINQDVTSFRNRLRTSDGGGALRFNGGTQRATLRVDGGDGTGHVDVDFDTHVALLTDLILLVNQTAGDPQHGALRLQQSWNGPGGLIKQGPGVATLSGAGKSFTGPLTIEQGVLRVTTPAVPWNTSGVSVLPGGQLRLVSAGTASEPSAHHYFGGGQILLAGMGRGGDLPTNQQLGMLGALRYDPGTQDNLATLLNPIQLTANSDIHIDGTRNVLRLEGGISGPFNLMKTGGGSLELDGNSALPAAPVTVETGALLITGSHPASISLAADTTLGGSGFAGPISGVGSVALTTQTLTASSSSVSRIAATFTTPGGLAGNGTLSLTATAPLAVAPSQIDLFLASPTPPLPGDRFAGGLLVPASVDLNSALAATEVRILIADPAGGIIHLGQSFRPSQAADQLAWSVVNYPQGRTLEILKSGTPTTYQQWRNLSFNSPAARADDAISGPTASAAGDDFSNLLRYAHGTGPHDPLQALLPQLDPAAIGGPAFRLRIANEKSDVAWIVRASPDLINWTETLFDSRTDPAPPPDAEGWSAITVPANRGRLFLRLELLLGSP